MLQMSKAWKNSIMAPGITGTLKMNNSIHTTTLSILDAFMIYLVEK